MKKYSDSLYKFIYSLDASHLASPSCDCIYCPESKYDVINILQFAIASNKKISLRGAGTNLVGSCLPSEDSIVIDFSKLNKINFNNNLIVESGVILDDLNLFLEKYNLYFPVVPGSHSNCLIGGMIATNAIGMRGFKYGKMIDWINSVNVIYIDENKNIIEKNISGDELKYFCGTEGFSGIILEANLKTTIKPKLVSLDFLSFENINDLLNKVSEIKNNKEISALEFIDKKISKLINLEEKYYLLIEYENNSGEIKDEKEIKRIWNLRDACYPTCAANSFILIEDPQIEDNNNLNKFINWLEEKNIPTFGHIGLGILHPHFLTSQNDLINEMYLFVKELNGKVSGEHGIGIKKNKFLSIEEKNYFSDLKKKFDPLNFFSVNNIL